MALPQHTGLKRWDGKAKTSHDWDSLHQDPDLWFRHGNCLVHLYPRGQARRGPTLRVPFSTLLAAQCHPLERFVARGPPEDAAGDAASHSLSTADYRARVRRGGRVDLYIPPPAGADLDQVLSHHVAVRNLFAWVFRRPLVGEHLGPALVGLLDTMRTFRAADCDNEQELLAYAAEVGYLQMMGQPDYAMGVLQLAEATQQRALYLEAFAHCVGLYGQLYLGTEYAHVSATSRRLIRRARLEMDARLGAASTMLQTFLEDALSDAHLGLPAAARAHLDRFRAYVLGYYTTRMGVYPPPSVDARSTIFGPRVFQTLAADFGALYDYLVDEDYTIAAAIPAGAQGGVCVLQSVESFDERHGYPSLPHPLPLLPEMGTARRSSHGDGVVSIVGGGGGGGGRRRMGGWFGGKTLDRTLHKTVDKLKRLQSRSQKLRPGKRLLVHAALLRATQTRRPEVSQNELVWAYRRFEEEEALAPAKADRGDKTARLPKISTVDARKVRWILIYAVHQTLRNCYLPPPAAVRHAGDVPYHVSISTAHLPPWEDEAGRKQPDRISRRLTVLSTASHVPLPETVDVTHEPGSPTAGSEHEDGAPTFSLDIQPDIDYLGLANRREPAGVETVAAAGSSPVEVEVVPRTRSLTRSLSRNAAIRRSLVLFRSNSTRRASAAVPGGQEDLQAQWEELTGHLPPSPSKSPRPVSRQSYREIVVYGYGNGMQAGSMAVPAAVGGPEGDSMPSPTTARTLSTASTNSNTSAASAATASSTATAESAETAATAVSAHSDKATTTAVHVLDVTTPSRSRPQRRFSVYGGGDEYAQYAVVVPPVPPIPSMPTSMSMPIPERPHSAHQAQYVRRLDSVREVPLEMRDGEVLVAAAAAAKGPMKKGKAVRHSSYHGLHYDTGYQGHDHGLDHGRRHHSYQARSSDVQPEWEKFSGLGGHTVLPPARG